MSDQFIRSSLTLRKRFRPPVGPGVAVVIGTAHQKGTSKDGKPFDRAFRFTDTWVKRSEEIDAELAWVTMNR